MAAPSVLFEGFGVINNADSATNWTGGALDTDSEKQGTGCIGSKVSNAQNLFSYDASGDTGMPLNFSSGGGAEGQHIYVWLNCLTPNLDTKANGGLRVAAGSDGTNYGEWYVGGDGSGTDDPYRGGWKSFVQSPEKDFSVANGSFTTTGNPAQLNAADFFGGTVKTIATIMGNFNNGLIDQISVGLGLRLEDGDSSTPGKLDNFVSSDEGTKNNSYGVVRSVSGVKLSQGKLIIGHDVGSADTLFSDTGSVLIFEDAPVSADFYEILCQDVTGTAQTNVLFGTKSAGVTSNGLFVNAAGTTEWMMTSELYGTASTWEIYATTLQSVNTASLNSAVRIEDSSILNSGKFKVSGAAIISCSFAGGVDFLQVEVEDSSEMDNIVYTSFNSCNRAIQINATGSYTFRGITFNGNTIDLRNASGGTASIAIVGGGSSPNFENVSGSFTSVVNNINITLTGLISGSEIRVYPTGSTTELDGIEDSTGSFSFTMDASQHVDIVIHKENYEHQRIKNFAPGADSSVPISQRFDRNYSNP